MAKRINELAKELGVQSKAIIVKCLAEGIPSDKVKNHMATVSAGLEASIREWFASAGGAATAVETAEHPDIERVKAAPRKRAGARAAGGMDSAGESDSATATETEPSPVETLTKRRRPATTPTAPPEVESRPYVAPPGETPTRPTAPVTVTSPTVVTPPAFTPHPLPKQTAPPATTPELAPAARTTTAGTGAPAETGTATKAPQADEDGEQASGTAVVAPAGPGVPARSVKPAPMNVPTRPKVVAPAGRKLEIKSPVRLAGPKVVRIEAPEQVDRPRPRRDAGGTDAPGGGRGVGAGAGTGTTDEEGRSPRRNKRRPAGAGAAAAAPPNRTGGVPARRKGLSGDEGPSAGGVWREQDLLEREARLQRAGGFLKKRRHEL